MKALLTEIRYQAIHEKREFYGHLKENINSAYLFPDSGGDMVFNSFRAFHPECKELDWDGFLKVDMEIPEFLLPHVPSNCQWGVWVKK